MDSFNTQLDSEMLCAYVDGEVSASIRFQLARYLAQHPEDAAKAEAFRAQNEALQRVGERISSEPTPDRFRDLVAPAAPGKKTHGSRWWKEFKGSVAAAAIVTVTAYAGWFARGALSQGQLTEGASSAFVQQAVTSYNLYSQSGMSPVSEIRNNDLSKFAGWFKQNLGIPVELPQLKTKQYKVVAARILPSSGGAAGQIIFTTQDGGKTFAWYFQVPNSSSATATANASESQAAIHPQHRSVGDVSVDYWHAGNVNYALVSAQKPNTLSSLIKSLWKAATD